MSIDHQASQDYEHALFKAIWRKILTRLTGESNELLPFDKVREHIPLRGQHYIGLREVPIDNIVGSMGRYRDFDRAFLPRQRRTRDRWINIDRAHYEEVPLPPVDLYKMGEIYFVKDGNHRVSVARERGQEFVDAHVIEIDVGVPLSPQTDITEIELKGEYARFIEHTKLPQLCPSIMIELTLPGEYERILEHINVHRWYLGEQRREEVPYEQAVVSWCENVYTPLAQVIEQQGIPEKFPDRTVSDLYLWTIEYLWYRREAYKEDFSIEEAAMHFAKIFADWQAAKLANLLRRAAWVDHLILEQERAEFFAKTEITTIRPDAQIELTVPGLYPRLLEHISVHRWYLGEQAGSDVPLEHAVASWYDNVYLPLVYIIRDFGILTEFPGRTESDLYLWIIEHQGVLREVYGELPLEVAAEHFAEDYSPDPLGKKRKLPKKEKKG